ncbi:hypothetical protein FSP39_012537 [Pinctada imbricata]|uniref:Integrase zinc-binding domain-containing protein n=1 Tax=Pinctada imbricata TaxID=66713 RepID=A0AA89BPG2_PINIB|nr:hypothetical protein FSP39_012537 [Pinctada imbricata]
MSYKAKKYSVKHVDFNSLATFIKFGTYPPGITENGKRNLRKRSQSFKVVDNQLFYTPVNASKEDGEPEISRPVISDEEEIQKLLSDLHVDEKGNHLGREKLGNKIRERFYFMGITKIVNSYIDNCSYCQVNRPSSRSSGILSEGSLSSLSSDTEEPETLVTSSPTICTNRIDVKVEGPSSKSAEAHRFWEIVEMNVLGPFTCKESKYYVVLFLDLFSYWPEAFVVDSLSPSTITHLLLKLLCRFGTMGTLMIRQTSESVQDNVSPRQDILSFLGLEITVNHFGADSTYVIWDDIKESVRTFTENNHHWLYCLEFCLLPFRISRAENSEYTPSYITYGREIPIPEKIHQQNEASITTVEPHLNMEQMTKITDVLLEAFKMFGKFSQPLESFPMSHIENRDVASKSESSASLVSKAYNTRRSRDVNYRRLSTNGEVDPEAEEDMPPPGSVTPEPRRKRRKMSRPGRIKVEDEKLEESLKEETDQESSKNSSMENIFQCIVWRDHLLKTTLGKVYIWTVQAFAKACPGCDLGSPLSDEISPEEEDDVAKCAEENYSHLISYVKNGKFSPDTDTSIHRAVLEVAKYFTLSRGQLMYRRGPKSGLRFFEISTRGKKAAIKDAHELQDQDEHLSADETYMNLTSSYLWYRMKDSVTDYIKQCCNKRATAQPVSKSRINFYTKYFQEQVMLHIGHILCEVYGKCCVFSFLLVCEGEVSVYKATLFFRLIEHFHYQNGEVVLFFGHFCAQILLQNYLETS